MKRNAFAAVLFIGLLAARQEPVAGTPDAELRAAFASWQLQWDRYVAAMAAARQAGKVQKGADLPAEVATLQRSADAARDAALARFGGEADLAAPSFLLLARLHEQARDYRAAVADYEHALGKGDADAPDVATMRSLCLAAMNSKDDALAARWMKTTIAAEDGRGGDRDLQLRTSWYPRTLIACGDWAALEHHLGALAADAAPGCRAAAATFGVVAAIHRGDLAAAREGLVAIRGEPLRFPDHQAWAVLAEFAFAVHDGRFDEAAALVRAFLAAPAAGKSAPDQNWRRYLRAVEPFLGKPAPHLRVDHWVGGEVKGDDALLSLRGRVVVLDFWQPWCEPCRKAMPEMVKAQREHGDDVQVIGVCKVEDYGYDVSERKAVRPIAPPDYPAHVADFRADMQLNYPLAICANGDNSTSYAIAGVPTLVVIDRAGIVRYMSCGAGEPGLFALALGGVLAAK
ncbi:MAG: TlpA disulfide reductase family protein [Planctomycetota bacterium]